MSDNVKKVEGYANVYKDTATGVIVNRGNSDRDRYRIAKRQALQTFEQRCEIDELKHDLSELKELKEEMTEIKSLLRELLGK